MPETWFEWFDWGLLIALTMFSGLFVVVWQGWGRKLEAYAQDPAYRARLIARHACTTADGYYMTLETLLDRAEHFYGAPKLRSVFGRCLSLAYFYPLLAALLAWVVANQTAPGGFEMFQDIPDWPDRLWRGTVFIIAFAALFWIIGNKNNFYEKLRDSLRQRIDRSPHRAGFLSKPARWGSRDLFTIVLAFTLAIALVGAVALAIVGAQALALTRAVAGAVAGAVALALTRAVAGAIFLAFAFPLTLADEPEVATSLMFLYLLLPLANALADLLSLSITHGFLRHMLRQRPGFWGIIGHLLFDLIAGLVCLALLLALLVGMLELWGLQTWLPLPFDWRAYRDDIHSDRWQGTALWLMAFTTLLPTLVHVVFAATIACTQKSASTRRAVALLATSPDPSPARAMEIAGLLRWGQVWGILGAMLIWVPVFLALVALMFGISWALGA